MRVPPIPEPEAGEWQREPGAFGRRYRKVGNCIEYEAEINGIPESIFHAMKKREKDEQAARYEEEQRKAAERAARRRNCPFIDSNALNTDCGLEACALYMDGCTLARLTPAKDTEGLQCPFNAYHQKCRTDCALYRGGCTLTGIPRKRG